MSYRSSSRPKRHLSTPQPLHLLRLLPILLRLNRKFTLTSATVSAIFNLTMTTANLRRAKAETVTLFSTSEGFVPVSTGPRVGRGVVSGGQGEINMSSVVRRGKIPARRQEESSFRSATSPHPISSTSNATRTHPKSPYRTAYPTPPPPSSLGTDLERATSSTCGSSLSSSRRACCT